VAPALHALAPGGNRRDAKQLFLSCSVGYMQVATVTVNAKKAYKSRASEFKSFAFFLLSNNDNYTKLKVAALLL
jgi:hypothetical protein